ncbi:Gag-Pol polyprotein [Schistosoma japonicum]|uniref:Gag-Pol polyprotein n=1 Tax=Schistosoma japonicum TaxID=6182 RepID=A0A4Z2CKH6_SCHJA|nr:Gag-Pol polyprotein [Schistosoma japonicum]
MPLVVVLVDSSYYDSECDYFITLPTAAPSLTLKTVCKQLLSPDLNPRVRRTYGSAAKSNLQLGNLTGL